MTRGLGPEAQQLVKSCHEKYCDEVDIVDKMHAQLCDVNKPYKEVFDDLKLTGTEWENHQGRKGKGFYALQNLRRSIEKNGVRVLERYIRDYVLNVAPDNPPALAPVALSSNNVAVVNDAPAAAAAAGNVTAHPPVAPIPAPAAVAPSSNNVAVANVAPAAAAAAGGVAARPPVDPIPLPPARGNEANMAEVRELLGASIAANQQAGERFDRQFGQVGGRIDQLSGLLRFQQLQLNDHGGRLDDHGGRLDNVEEDYRYLHGEYLVLAEDQHNLWEGQRNLWGDQHNLREGQRNLWEDQHNLWGDQHNLREGQRNLWEDQHNLWEGHHNLEERQLRDADENERRFNDLQRQIDVLTPQRNR